MESISTSPPPEEFALVDQWAAEAYLTALDAGEIKLMDMLNRGEKIHDWMWNVTKQAWPAFLPESSKAPDGYNYKKAKQSVHALNYGVRAQKMAQESGLPIQVCEWQFGYYHSQFPGIRLRQARIKEQLAEGFLVSVLGRKRIFIAQLNEEILNQAYAWPSQSVIGEITNIALTKLMWAGMVLRDPWMFPALNTHDGMAIRVPKGVREKVKRRVRDAFNIPLTKNGITITIPVEIAFSTSFDDSSIEKGSKEVMRYEVPV